MGLSKIFGICLFVLYICTPTYAIQKRTPNNEKVTDSLGKSQVIETFGLVPIGGMVAVMPSVHTRAWLPPATGKIKDGFMRADGHTITAQNVVEGSLFPAGTVLPNMIAKYPRGSSTSGNTGGNNDGHNHGFGTGSGMSVSIDHTHGGSSVEGSVGGSDGAHPHSSTSYRTLTGSAYWADNLGGLGVWDGASGIMSADTTLGTPTRVPLSGGRPGVLRINASHDHSVESTGSGHGHGFSLTATGQSYTGSPSVSGTVGLVTGGFDGNAAGSNEPAYVETVWVIRVM